MSGGLPSLQESALTRSSFLFTSESVSEGHPDKVADRISDTVVDAFLTQDPEARVACETLVTTQRIVLAGEVRATRPGNTKEENEAFTQGIIDSLEPLVRAAVRDIGYEQEGFHWRTASYECHLHAQSADIAVGVDSTNEKEEGAGDQASCSATPRTRRPS
jgi:S-adenosylmethionine synthetase